MLARVRIPLTASEWVGLFAGHRHISRATCKATRRVGAETQLEPDTLAAQRLYERRGDGRPLLRLRKPLSGMGEAA
jgi:hypothetical protein